MLSVKNYKKFLIFILILFLILFLVYKINLKINSPDEYLFVSFLDVGQGDAIFIRTENHKNILIDAGDGSLVISEISKKIPHWDRVIDLFIITHPHSDHIGGAINIFEYFEVKKILYTGVVHSSPDYISFLKAVQEKNIPLVIIDREQKIILSEDCYLEILYPDISFLGNSVVNLNNTSIVSRLVYGENSFLFMGDVEKEVEDILIESDIDLKSDLIKIGHHGSDTSSSDDFLNQVDPQIAVIEVGSNNNFGHPSLRVLKRLERMNIEIFRTDLDGSVNFVGDKKQIKRINED